MQIREQGRKIQCIRTVYDKTIKRGRQTVVATFPRHIEDMPTTGLDVLTEAERIELEEWLTQRREATQRKNEVYMINSAEHWLGVITSAIRNGNEISPKQAEIIWNGIGEIGKALRKAGHSKPKAVRKG